MSNDLIFEIRYIILRNFQGCSIKHLNRKWPLQNLKDLNRLGIDGETAENHAILVDHGEYRVDWGTLRHGVP